MTFWERKQMFLKTGRYPSRGFRGGRGGMVRGRGRGRGVDQGKTYSTGASSKSLLKIIDTFFMIWLLSDCGGPLI